MIDAFGGPDSVKGNTGPFWVGSGLAVFSAIVTYFLVRPLDQDAMIAEDLAVSSRTPAIVDRVLIFSSVP